MIYFDEPFRAIACAAKMRDWDVIDAVLEDLRVQGRMSVIRGFIDARKRLGEEPPLKPVEHDEQNTTIHDLPSMDGIEIVTEHSTPKWRRRKAA